MRPGPIASARRLLLAPAALLVILAAAADLRAGVVVLGRQSAIEVSGTSDAGTYQDDDGTTELGTFADLIEGSVGAPPNVTRSSAQQFSTVQALGAGERLGVSGEAEVMAQVAEFGGQGAFGESELTVRFQVVGEAEPWSTGGTLFGTLGGSALARLVNEAEVSPEFQFAVDQGNPGGGLTFSDGGVLQPGTYALTFRAFATGTPSPERASFSVRFDVGAAQPIPLPPAAVSGLTGLALAGVCAKWQRRRKRRV